MINTGYLRQNFLNIEERHNQQMSDRSSPLKRYWKILLLTSFFFGLPAIQYVFFQVQSRSHNETNSINNFVNSINIQQDNMLLKSAFTNVTNLSTVCYFNYKCCHSILKLYCFNNIISNVCYIVCGLAFVIIVLATDSGEDKNIYVAVGLTTILEGLFSALYHVCPNRSNFQFDTTYMMIGVILIILSYFQKGKRKKIISFFKLFGFMALLVLFNTIELTRLGNNKNPIFWSSVGILMFIACVYCSSNIYFGKDNWHIRNLICCCSSETIEKCDLRNNNKKLVLSVIIFGNITNWILFTIAYLNEWHFSTITLGVLILDLVILKIYYLILKLFNGEKISKWIWLLFLFSGLMWSFALYFFTKNTTNKYLTPEESMELNSKCVLFDYFDTHDVWHFFSSLGMFSLLLITWFVDFNIRGEHDRYNLIENYNDNALMDNLNEPF